MQTVIIVASGALSKTLLIFKWIQNNNGDEKRHIIIAMARQAGTTTDWLMNGEWGGYGTARLLAVGVAIVYLWHRLIHIIGQREK